MATVPAPLYTTKFSKDARMPQRAQRRPGKPEPLPVFSFPAPPHTSQSCKDSDFITPLPPRHILNLPPTAPPTSSPHRHRRSQAISTSRASLSKRQNETAPPVPAIPAIYRTAYSPPQLPSRSMSDVSSCPTLESDSGMASPVSFRYNPMEEAVSDFDFGSDLGFELADSEASPSHLYEAVTGVDELHFEDSNDDADVDDDDDEDDDDDDDEFWHCRGISESAQASRKASFAVPEDESSGVDVDAWAKAVEQYSYGQVWDEEKSFKSSDFDIYMDLMRHPLLAPGWLGE